VTAERDDGEGKGGGGALTDMSVEETNKMRAKLGLKPLEGEEPMRQFPGGGRGPGRCEAAVPAALDPGLRRGTDCA